MMSKSKKTIFISTSNFNLKNFKNLNNLKKNRFKIVKNPLRRKLTTSEIDHFLKSNVIGLIAGVETIGRKTLVNAKALKAISRCGSGLDNIDLVAAKKLQIKVTNTPYAPVNAVAELTVGSIICLLRKIHTADKNIREGFWKPCMGNLLSGRTVGIVGFGKIGSKVSKILKGFNVKILAYDFFIKKKKKNIKFTSMNKLLRKSDIVTLHLPLDHSTFHLIGRKELSLMKKSAYICNFSRGGLIDEKALFWALKTKKIKGAALDCFENEPYKGSLRRLKNILLSPHMGSYAIESRNNMEREAADNLVKKLRIGK